ncbi:hypothetical protein [Actinomyces qiguomingii]|nr:hypothetical protein [Actinomyces qiguomingii]
MGLFNRRRKQSGNQPAQAADAVAQPEASQDHTTKEALRERASALTAQLEELTDPEERIRLLNERGGLLQQLGDYDAAIESYEASMAIREQFGPAYSALLSLYNDRLKAAAKARDDAAIEEWTAKLDGLTALSKRVMRSQF